MRTICSRQGTHTGSLEMFVSGERQIRQQEGKITLKRLAAADWNPDSNIWRSEGALGGTA